MPAGRQVQLKVHKRHLMLALTTAHGPWTGPRHVQTCETGPTVWPAPGSRTGMTDVITLGSPSPPPVDPPGGYVSNSWARVRVDVQLIAGVLASELPQRACGRSSRPRRVWPCRRRRSVGDR